MADTPYDPPHPRFGEWCDVHGEEFQDHDCDLLDPDDGDEYRWVPHEDGGRG